MRFFRRRSSFTLAALIATAMQVALVLAQMHAHQHVHASVAGRHARAPSAALACRAVVHRDCPPAVPHRHDEGGCKTCSALAAAGTAVLPVLPIAAPAAATGGVVSLPRPAPAPPARATAVFDARGPPLA